MIDLDSMSDDDKLAALESIHKSIAESKELQKQKIAANVDLVLQALKKMESDIRARYDETGKTIEKRVASIKDGRDGRNGLDGKNGKDGRNGKDGLKGDKGDKGLDGIDGVDGVDGVSVTDAKIDFDGSLIITLSTGQEINVGEVVSPDLADKIQVISTMSTNGAVGIKDEGTSISTGVKNINFVGAAVTATNSGDDVTVNVSAGTGTVTSVAVSGGTTGLTTSGGPITTTGTITLAGTLAVANGGTGVTTSTGTTNVVLSNSPTLVTPALGTPSSATLTNATGLPIATGVSGLGTGVATFLATPSSANLASAVTDETGSGSLVFATSPTLITPALGTPASGVVTNLTGTASININGTVGATTPAAGTFTSLSDSGNLNFTGTGNRITGDFSNATNASRVSFQTSTANSSTFVNFIPSGTGSRADLRLFSSSDPDNASNLIAGVSVAGEARFNSSFVGTGTYLPMTFYTGGSERVRVDTSGNVGIGTSSPNGLLHVNGTINIGSQTQNSTSTAVLENRVTSDPSTTARAAITLGTTAGASSSDSYIAFTTNQYGVSRAERMRIDPSGNVGIGTSSPSVKLHVVGSGKFTGITEFTNAINLTTSTLNYVYFNDALAFARNGTGERMRIDSSGNVGIGTTSPDVNLDVTKTSDGVAARFQRSSGGGIVDIETYNGIGGIGTSDNIPFRLNTNNTERARITSDGDVYVGTTTGGAGADSNGFLVLSNGLLSIRRDSGTAMILRRWSSNGEIVTFRNTSNSDVGNITTTASTTAYNTSSDYRLKEAIAPMTGALAKVALLKPVTYKWKIDGSDGQGFIAHELAEVVPGCVSGEKDAVGEQDYEVTPAVKDEEGNTITEAVMGTRIAPVYQGIDTSFLVATLTAAIQEQQALITALTTRITALESN